MLAEPETGQARALTTRLIAALARRPVLSPSDVSICEELLRSPGLSNEAYDRALSLLAAVIYWRPDLVGEGTAAAMEALFAGPPLPEPTHRDAAEVLNFLLATPAASTAADRLVGLLARPGLPAAAYGALLGSLEYASTWAMPFLDLAALVDLAEND